jgi:hypothetical protein
VSLRANLRAIRILFGLELPISGQLISIKKDPNCRDPMCGPDGIRKDVRMGKLMGGGPVYDHCIITETVEKNRANKIRKFIGLEPFR